MQESRRRRRLEFGLLSLTASLAACASPPSRLLVTTPAQSVPSERASRSAKATHPALALPPTQEAAPLTAPSPAVPATQVAALSSPPASHADDLAPSAPSADPRRADLPRGTLVLHVGDSFAGALGLPLGKRLKAAGIRSVLQFKTSSYIPTWAFGDELTRFVSNYNPDLVLVTLGANEFDIPDPNQRITAIHRLVAKIGQRPCVWVSPPRWKADTGLMEVIRRHAAPCVFLDSDTLVRDLPRARDQIHPSTDGREIWANAVFEWLEQTREPAGDKPWALRVEQPPAPTASVP